MCKKQRTSVTAASNPSQTEEKCATSLVNMPPEIQTMILGYLPTDDLLSMSRVSRRFKSAVLDHPAPTLWRSIDLSTLSLSLARRLSTRCPFLRSLSFNGVEVSERRVEDLLQLFLGFEKLEKLDLSYVATGKMLKWIRTHFRNLKELNIRGTANLKIRELNLLGSCKDLESLDLSFATINKGDATLRLSALRVVAHNFPRLKMLNLEGFSGECDDGLESVIKAHCGTLTQLYLSGHSLRDCTLSKLGDCRQLEELTIVSAAKMADQSLYNLRDLKKLRKLVLGSAVKVTRFGWFNFFVKATPPNLEVVEVPKSRICNRALGHMNLTCKKLRRLNLAGCSFDEGILGSRLAAALVS